MYTVLRRLEDLYPHQRVMIRKSLSLSRCTCELMGTVFCLGNFSVTLRLQLIFETRTHTHTHVKFFFSANSLQDCEAFVLTWGQI